MLRKKKKKFLFCWALRFAQFDLRDDGFADRAAEFSSEEDDEAVDGEEG